MKILLFGKNGQVGWELHRSLQAIGEVVALGRDEADFENLDGFKKIIEKYSPQIIINAVAYTAVDKAETEEQLANKVNGYAPGALAQICRDLDVLLIHISTDYVFDGKKKQPYLEADSPNPVNAYGRSKLLGEQLIINSGCRCIILRTSWVYAARGKNFVNTISKIAFERDELKVVNDQHGSPTWARYIADTIIVLIQSYTISAADKRQQMEGVFHLANQGECTWYEFAKKIVEDQSTLKGRAPARIKPVTTQEFAAQAPRPLMTVLNTEKITQIYGLPKVKWDASLGLCLEELQEIYERGRA